jgi:hypothetical protein
MYRYTCSEVALDSGADECTGRDECGQTLDPLQGCQAQLVARLLDRGNRQYDRLYPQTRW